MRNFSLISVLLALVIGAVLWTRQLDNVPTKSVPPVIEFEEHRDEDISMDHYAACDENDTDSSDCQAESSDSEHAELEDQRKRAYGTIMDSFDSEYGKYREQTGGRP